MWRADVRERVRVAVGAVDLGADRADAHVSLRAQVPGRDPARVVPGVVAHVVVDGDVGVLKRLEQPVQLSVILQNYIEIIEII